MFFNDTLDSSKVSLYFYKDPISGPRTIPSLEQPFELLSLIKKGSTFTLQNASKPDQNVVMTKNGLSHSIGCQLVYQINEDWRLSSKRVDTFFGLLW